MSIKAREIKAEDYESLITLWKEYLILAGCDLDTSIRSSKVTYRSYPR